MTLVLYDTEDMRPIKVQEDGIWWRLEGACLRCGKCCLPHCEHLVFEIVDDEPRTQCEIHASKPWQCALWPRDPSLPLEDGCGFKWVKE